ncbi:MarR family winged helix-turn-helix transcriptional regulator [Actinoplanes sp. CA-142083]|uniref:MarR family winged helix-turn-helix transcriptional regulator n=1 Tax=Actinoplanes sp. CA-142083 TaxID=3239903 RepID=UPI003D8E5681
MRKVTDVRWLDATQQRAWRGFLDLHAQLAARLNRDLQQTSGLTLSDYDVLVHLTDVPEGRLRAFELGDGLQWDKSRVSKQVARLAARGLVAKEQCETDRRGAYVVLTPLGREAIEAAAPAHVELVHRLVFDTLSPGQIRQWAAISAAVLRKME